MDGIKLYELKKSEFFRVLPILNKNRNDLTFSYSVINKVIDGSVYVNDKINPKTVVIFTESGLGRIIGDDLNKSFNKELDEIFSKRLNEKKFTLCSSSIEWDNKIISLIGDRIYDLKRSSFEYNVNKSNIEFEIKENIPKGFIIKKLTKDLINHCNEFNEDYYIKYWGSIDNFIKNGFGYCALFNGKVVGVCTSIYANEKYAEIDIFTDEKFRGKGLAFLLSKIFIRNCIDNNIIPSWDCETSNLSSYKLANRLGFEYKGEYTIYARKIIN